MAAPIRVQDQVEIRRPIGDVFDFVSDVEHIPVWRAGVQRARRTTPGPVGVGTTYTIVGRMLGRRVESTYEVTAYEPGALMSGRMESRLFAVEETYRVEPLPDGVRLHVEMTARPERVLRLLGPVAGAAFTRQVRADHQKLKSVLEKTPKRKPAPAPAPPPGAPAEPPADAP